MEKIKQALDRARQERGVSLDATGSDEIDSPVKYSTTQLIKGSVEKMQESRVLSSLDNDQYSDAYNILAIQVIQRMEEHRWTTLAVTSPTGREGNTTAAINLAISIAKEVEYSVVLVDANLRNPAVHEYFGIQPKYGLCDYLRSDIELSDVFFLSVDIEYFLILLGC